MSSTSSFNSSFIHHFHFHFQILNLARLLLWRLADSNTTVGLNVKGRFILSQTAKCSFFQDFGWTYLRTFPCLHSKHGSHATSVSEVTCRSWSPLHVVLVELVLKEELIVLFYLLVNKVIYKYVVFYKTFMNKTVGLKW